MSQRIPLAYDERGAGTPLVLLHAFPFSRAMWQNEVEVFSAKARVIVPDLCGFGASARLPEPSMANMAQAVVALLDTLDIQEPVVLCGLSMGGYVAFEVVRQCPQRVKALGLLSTRATSDTPQQRQARFRLIERIPQEGLEVILEGLLPKLLGATSLASRPDVVSCVTQLIRQAIPQGVMDALQAMAHRRDATNVLSTIASPTLVVAGEEDALIPVSDARALARQIPGASCEVIPAAGHLVNLEQPVLFRAAIERLLC